MLTATDITVHLGRKNILHGIDFTAKPGHLTAIVGPNGSGKTTLLRAMTGEADFGGSVTLNGHDITRARPWQLAAIRSVLPQATPPLSFPFTVFEVVRLGGLTHGLEAGHDDLVPPRALARVGLSGSRGGGFSRNCLAANNSGCNWPVRWSRSGIPWPTVTRAGCFWMNLSRRWTLGINCKSCRLPAILPMRAGGVWWR